jgi:hypothetical protein
VFVGGVVVDDQVQEKRWQSSLGLQGTDTI